MGGHLPAGVETVHLAGAHPETLFPEEEARRVVGRALAEDVGAGDLTTLAVVPAGARAQGRIVFREGGVVCGLPLVSLIYRALSDQVQVEPLAADGDALAAGQAAARVHGPARALLTGERLALNFLQRLSGGATLTRRFVETCGGTRARVVDTRKTTPGLRALEKYAVRVGGGTNHRFGLFDAILIKDNHVHLAGGVGPALDRAQAAAGPLTAIEVEVDTLAQLAEALEHGADRILLDNMDPATLRRAVEQAAGRALLEASGGINLDTIRAVAETGVDFISVGALTHSAPSLDIALDLEGFTQTVSARDPG